MKILTDKGKVMSAALCLVHEAEHALQSIMNPKQYQNDKNTEDDEYHNLEDERVILGPEQNAAEKIGETEKGEPIRESHSGTPLCTDDPKSHDYNGELDVNIEAVKAQQHVTEGSVGYLGRIILLLIGGALLTRNSCRRSDSYTTIEPRTHRMTRHFYDLEKLMQTPYAAMALNDSVLYREIVEHCRKFYHVGYVDYDKELPANIQIVPCKELMSAYEADYNEMKESFIYGQPLTFGELMEKITNLQEKFGL